jgi:Tfp pilus assembly protein PilO
LSGLRSFIEQLKKRQKGFVRLAILLVVNAVVFAAITYRLANKQDRLAVDQARLTAELAEKSEQLERLSTAEGRVVENASAVTEFWADTVKTRVPGLTEAWEEIDRLANETNVVKGRTGYDRDLLDVGLEQIKATMPVEGNYFDLVRFINRLERSPRFFLVEEVRLSQRDSDDATIRLDCSISFYLKAQSTTGPAQGVAGP